MSLSHRSLSLALILSLCAVFGGAAPRPVAAAAGVFTVTTTQDLYGATCGAPCSLRQAINAANDAGPGSTIAFNIPNTDPGYDPSDPSARTWTITPASEALPYIITDTITIDGTTQATNRGGNPNIFGPEIIINGANVTDAGGITLVSDGNVVRGLGIVNFRGGNPTGTGIEIQGDNNSIQGNYIGLNKYGLAALGNTGPGIWVRGRNNLIGGNSSTEFNVISGNEHDGILIEGDDNQVRGNYIGTDRNGINEVPNLEYGVNIRIRADRNIIGTNAGSSDAVFRNVISGNGKYGIVVRDSVGNQIYGNWIGLDDTGDARLPNTQGGVQLLGIGLATSGNIIGGTTQPSRNLIAGNGGPGVNISGRFATGNTVANNNIGLGLSNVVPGGEGTNQTFGVLIDKGASGNTIGGAARNVISGNGGDGVRIVGDVATSANSDNNVVSANYIGAGADGSTAIANTGAGVALLSNAHGTRVGGASAAERNLIAFNVGAGVVISGTTATSNTLLKNSILSNGGSGVLINRASSTMIDGGASADPTEIAENGADGIRVSEAVSTTIRFGFAHDNAENGVRVTDSISTTILSSTLNLNGANGALVDGGSTDVSIRSSTVYTNTGNGVTVADSGTQRVSILDNSISGNGLKGIELAGDTEGTPGVASNPNHDINPPFGLRLNQNGLLTGRVLVDASPAACITCTIQIFTTNPATLDGEGRSKLNAPITIDASGNFTATIGAVAPQLALTATDRDGNTSEFAVFTSSFGVSIEPPRSSSAAPGQSVTYSHTVSNIGSVDLLGLQLSANSLLGWSRVLTPAGAFDLRAGESRLVTLTLTLPTGAAPNVRAGLVEETGVTVRATALTTVTDTVSDTTTVLGRVVLAVTPTTSSGSGIPGSVVPYAHTITNNGNITTTVALTVSTDLGWVTSIEPITATLAPGESTDAIVLVTVPEGALVPTEATTTISVTVEDNPSQNRVLTDTTTVVLTQKATLVASQEGDAGAGETIFFTHTATNRSNGPATFRLVGRSSLGSRIRFVSISDITIGADNSFTLGTAPTNNELNFMVEVTVDERALRGQTDTITVYLTDEDGRTIGGAVVQDLIRVTRGAIVPRLYLPVIRQGSRP